MRLLVAEAPPTLLDRLADEGIGIERIRGPHPDPLDVERDRRASRPRTPTAARRVDGPAFDAAYPDALGGCARRVMVVDDMAAWPRYPVALVLNQNAHADRRAIPGDGTEYLLGLAYNLLRREFRAARSAERQIPPRRAGTS